MDLRTFTAGTLAIGLCLSACPDVDRSRPSEACTKAHEKCTLPSGVLGICDIEGNDDPPRLICRSQH